METTEGGEEEIYNCSFNQDNGCFIVSTSRGIRVFNTHEFQSTFFRGKSIVKFRCLVRCFLK